MFCYVESIGGRRSSRKDVPTEPVPLQVANESTMLASRNELSNKFNLWFAMSVPTMDPGPRCKSLTRMATGEHSAFGWPRKNWLFLISNSRRWFYSMLIWPRIQSNLNGCDLIAAPFSFLHSETIVSVYGCMDAASKMRETSSLLLLLFIIVAQPDRAGS